MSQVNYTLQYRPIDELIAEANIVLKKYNSSSVIQPADIIDIAWKVTYDLGLRIFQVNENVLELYHYIAKLPDNFFSLNYAFLCALKEQYNIIPTGTQLEVIPTTPEHRNFCDGVTPCDDSCNTTAPRKVITVCNGSQYEIIQKIGVESYRYRNFIPVRLKHYSGITKTCDGCPNMNIDSTYEIDIRNGFVYANVEQGNLYINYMGYPMDEQGNMLIPDHPYINEYYKYAVIRRIYEDLLLNGIVDPNVFKLIEQRYIQARNTAVSFVNTPNFSELRRLWEINRKAQYAKYYQFFTRH